MNPYATLFMLFSSLLRFQIEDRFTEIRADVDNLKAKLADLLPKKDDGSAYTPEEIHAEAEAARVPFTNVLGHE
jgi:hypothetical protein